MKKASLSAYLIVCLVAFVGIVNGLHEVPTTALACIIILIQLSTINIMERTDWHRNEHIKVLHYRIALLNEYIKTGR